MIRMPRFAVWLLGAALLCSGTARAVTPDEALARFVDATRTLSADFEQSQTDDSGRLLSHSTGHLWLERPGKFRWSYDKPYEQLVVCDGDKVWMYDKDLAQVTARPAGSALSGTPAALLAQTTVMRDAFNIEDLGGSGGLRALRLTPKSADAEFQSIELWLTNDKPERMMFTDPLGGKTEVKLHQLQVNQAIDPKLLQFTPPPGVEVVDSGAP
jgi:chaperone LolA